MKRTVIAVSIAMLSLVARGASGAAIDFQGVGKSASVQFSLNATTRTESVGELKWGWMGSTPTGYTATFYSYCLDLLTFVVDPETVALKSTDLLTSSGPYVNDAGAKAAWLFNTYAPTIHTSGSDFDAAALQIAIWEAIYDTSANIAGGAFRLITTGAVAAKATTYLTALYSGPGGTYNKSRATWLDATSGSGQDQLVAMPAPEPASLLLCGIGLAALARQLRRRSRGSRQTANRREVV